MRSVFTGTIKPKKKLNIIAPRPCPTCGGPTRKVAVFDLQEVYLTGECRASDSHEPVAYDWPLGEHQSITPDECRRLGFKVVSA